MKFVERLWYQLENVDEVSSPALLIYRDRALENIRRMIRVVGGDVSRLRPHIKTHKLPELVTAQLEQGITRFKCATIAEAEMLALAGAPDVLLAYQPVGPNVARLIQLKQRFPKTDFSAVVDHPQAIKELSHAAKKFAGVAIDLWLDIDCGMRRTGIAPGPEAAELYRLIGNSTGLRVRGLHVYDGHIHERDLKSRETRCEACFSEVLQFKSKLEAQGMAVPRIIAGGTPTFPMHARRGKEVECSPGTCVLWDFGYSSQFADLDFLHAALVLTRVVSKPGGNRLCLDLGHKAIASENPHPRVQLLDIPAAKFVTHSEEHLVIETDQADHFPIGAAIYGVPWHVCPTVALYSSAFMVIDRRAGEPSEVVERARRLSI